MEPIELICHAQEFRAADAIGVAVILAIFIGTCVLSRYWDA